MGRTSTPQAWRQLARHHALRAQGALVLALGSVVLMASILLVGGAAQADEAGRVVANFSLPAGDNQQVSLPEDARAVVVCFLGTECPLARLYAPRLQKLADQYAAKGVVFIGVDSNLQDTLAEVARFRQSNNIRFPIAMDYDQAVAGSLGATRTPEVVVLDSRRTIRYQGRIDDQYLPGVVKPQATVSELVEALDAVLAGESLRVTKTQSIGCLIGRPKKSGDAPSVTYTGRIARIFQANCVECHRSGEIGPFAMTEYEELRGWGDMIVEVINDGRMPPWHAASGHLPLRNERSMSDSDKQAVRDWVDAGMPYGQAAELPAVPPENAEWYLTRPPDLAVEMRKTPYTIPAEGTVDYQYFVVDPGLTEDKWISEAQVVPGNPGVVHHAIVFIRPPDGVDARGISWLTAYVPGQRQHVLPLGSARRIPAGSKFVFQMHYTPNGTPQQDLTKVGMLFVDKASVKSEVTTLMAINQEFEIPPQVADYPVTAKLRRLPKGGQLLAVSPHMHVRGKSFELFMKQGDQQHKMLDVPRYDFNWQHTYELAEPLPLDGIDSIEFMAKFDNSSGNPVNPNPNDTVTWGDQTWEEMAVAFFEVSQPLDRQVEDKPAEISAAEQQQKQQAAQKFAEDFLTRLDANRDGHVHFDETPLSIQRYSFHRFDANGDRKIERAELVNVYR